MYCPYEINPYKTQSDITHVKCLQLQKQALSRFTFVIIKGIIILRILAIFAYCWIWFYIRLSLYLMKF